jgi:hypothetical protein
MKGESAERGRQPRLVPLAARGCHLQHDDRLAALEDGHPDSVIASILTVLDCALTLTILTGHAVVTAHTEQQGRGEEIRREGSGRDQERGRNYGDLNAGSR